MEATGLVKHYGSRSGVVEAVRGVNLTVRAGEVFGFLGPNGAGKSTTVRMLTTLLTITAGSARVAGVDVIRDPDAARHRMGVALQEAGLDPRQTGRELLVLQGRLFDLSPRDAAARAEQLLELVELEDAADRRIKGYSGGMKRRLDLASALVHEPEVLFLDEPTTGLDPASRLTVWDEVKRINGRGTTVFLTTQYLEEADQLCDRLAIIDDGRIVREGTPGELKAELRERLGLDAEPSLDDVFLDATGRTPQPRRRRRAGGVPMTHALVLGQRALREAWRTPEALVPTMFIPLFFLVVNVGQAGDIFPSESTAFLEGQGYGAFQLPSSLLLAASFGTAALFLVEDIEGGYFDKLRSAPISRVALVMGRLIAESVKGLLIATAIVLLPCPSASRWPVGRSASSCSSRSRRSGPSCSRASCS